MYTVVEHIGHTTYLVQPGQIEQTRHTMTAYKKLGGRQLEMTDQAREARREYMKQWRANNQERTREYNRRYWAKKAEEAASERKKSEDSGSGGAQ